MAASNVQHNQGKVGELEPFSLAIERLVSIAA